MEFIRNAGTDIGEGLKATSSNVGLKYSDGESCVNGSNQTVSYSTDIDFICQQVRLSHLIIIITRGRTFRFNLLKGTSNFFIDNKIAFQENYSQAYIQGPLPFPYSSF